MTDQIDLANREMLSTELSKDAPLAEAHRILEQSTTTLIDFIDANYPEKRYFHVKKELDGDGSFEEVTVRIENDHTHLSVDRQLRNQDSDIALTSSHATILTYTSGKIISDMEMSAGQNTAHFHGTEQHGKEPNITGRNIGGGFTDADILRETRDINSWLGDIRYNSGFYDIEVEDEPPLGPDNRFPIDPLARNSHLN